MMSEKSAEIELLMLAARPTLSTGVMSRMSSSVGEVTNWEEVVELAQDHGILSLVYDHLQCHFAHDVPKDVIARLSELNQANVNHGFCLMGELIKLIDLFRGHDITAIPFKGPTLSLLAFGEVALRQFADLDILISKEHIPRVRKILAAHGFEPLPRLTTGQEAALLRFDCAQNFSNQQGVTVDVHWNLAPKYLAIDIDMNVLGERLQPIQIGQQKLLTLSQENLLVALSIHGFTHNWERLGLISDIAGLLERNATDWRLLLLKARRLGLRRIVSVALLLAKKLGQARIPSGVLTEIEQDAVAVKLANRFAQDIFTPGEGVRPLDSALYHLRIRERFRDKILGAVRLLTTPRAFDWMSLSIPASLSVLYYLFRPVRLVLKHGTTKLTRPPQENRLGRESAR